MLQVGFSFSHKIGFNLFHSLQTSHRARNKILIPSHHSSKTMEIAIDTPIDINLEKGWKITEKHETIQNFNEIYNNACIYTHWYWFCAGITAKKCSYICSKLPSTLAWSWKEEIFLVNIVWNPWMLTKVGFFAWEAVWGRIWSLD